MQDASKLGLVLQLLMSQQQYLQKCPKTSCDHTHSHVHSWSHIGARSLTYAHMNSQSHIFAHTTSGKQSFILPVYLPMEDQ